MSLMDTPWPAIFAMTMVTYGLRAGGFWLMGQVELTPRVRRGLEALPGAIFVATVVPLAFRAGVPGVAAVVAAALVMHFVKLELLALIAGLGVAAGLRAMGV